MSNGDGGGLLLPALVVAAVAAACGLFALTEDEQTANCVGEDGVVVDPAKCDDADHHTGGGVYPYWLYMGPRLNPGDRAPAGWETSRFSPTDTAARTRVGLPSTGRVGGVTVKTGGLGGLGRGLGFTG